MGRTRAAMAVAEGATSAWTGSFPNNPFAVPIVLDDSGETVELAKGLAEGLLQESIEAVRILRRARLELEKPLEAARSFRDLEKLTWRDLTPKERAICPVLILVGDGRVLGGEGAAQLAALLGSDRPVKAVLLADLAEGIEADLDRSRPGQFTGGAAADAGLLGLMQRNAYIVQSSIAYGGHLTAGVLGALRHPGPALIHIHAPKPSSHGFAADRATEQAGRAVRSRAFPLFIYDPSRKGGFGVRLDLEGNPQPEADWSAGDDGDPFTAVDWMRTEERFARHFAPLDDQDPMPTPVADYLALPHDQRSGKTPFLAASGGEGGVIRTKCSSDAAAFAGSRLEIWRMLQEWSGIVTPFTQKVREEAEAELKQRHEAELAKLRQEYEGKMAGLSQDIRREMAQRLQQKMMALAGHRRPPGNGDNEDDLS
jgi:pyruvate-ferredoxin/flavodoxin oxidoreductase